MIWKWMNLLKNYRLHFTLALLLASATILTGIGLMSTSGYLISRAAQRPMIVDLFMITAAVRFFGISRAVVRYFERLVSHDLTFKVLLSMRIRVYRSIDSRSIAWMMGRRPGDLLARLVTDIETLQNAYLRIVSPVITAVLISIITVFTLSFFNPLLALATLFFHILSGIVIPVISVYLAKGRGRADVKIKSGLKVFLVDRLSGLQDLLWLGGKKKTIGEFSGIQRELDSIQHKNAGVSGFLEGLSSLFANLGMFAVLILAIPIVIKGEIPGVMLAMLTLGVLSSFEAMQSMGNAFLQYENSAESSDRIFSLTGNQIQEKQISLSQNLPENYTLTFRDVSFSYKEELITLKNIGFDIPFGSKTAIIGPTGSGKSTLVNLMLKLWEPQSGNILLGNINIRELDDNEFRSLFTVASQETFIFNRSFRENLLIANSLATDKEISGALKSVGLHFLIDKLDIKTGNQGMKLSGGERQLFSIARCLMKKTPFWILDEPSANLDIQTEKKIFDLLLNRSSGQTLILITHRLVNMDRMDKIIVMDRGEIVEQGTHESLLLGDTLYNRMYNRQMELIRD